MPVRAVRGAITVKNNSTGDIIESTRELLEAMVKENGIETDDIISILFTVTSDLNAAFPATAARLL